MISDVPEAPPETAAPDRPLAAPVPDAHAIAERLRAEFSEIATIAAQAARLGIDVDAADAMPRGLTPDALRRTILETLAGRLPTSSPSPCNRRPAPLLDPPTTAPSSGAPANGRPPQVPGLDPGMKEI